MLNEGSSPSPRKLARPTFAERLCGHHRQPLSAFCMLAWQHGASAPTRVLRPLILLFAPSYFEAEDMHLARAAECRWRHHIVDELELMRVSPLRRGIWRRLRVGLSEARLVRYYDHIVALEVIENEAVRIAQTETRARPGTAVNQEFLS